MNTEFRVWDIQRKEMIYSEDGGDYFLLNQNGILFCFDGNVLDDWHSSFLIQFFTGFIDTKGKKVFDGDLIEGDGHGPYRVFWDKNIGGWCSCCYRDAELIGGYKTIEVISNIFETPIYEGVQ